MTPSPDSDVTIIGLGTMGSALARTLLATGHRVTVWNRTATTAQALQPHGALTASSLRDAIGASPVSIACLRDNIVLRSLLEEAGSGLGSGVLVNLTSGDSAQARALADWFSTLGMPYLDGAIMAVPSAIGTPAATLLLSGSRSAFEASRPLLDALGTATYLDEDPGLAALYDAAGLTMMWGVLNSWLQGVALVRAAGIDAPTFTPFARDMAQGTASWLAAYAGQVERHDFPADDATVATHAGSMEHLIHECEALGISAELPKAYLALAERAVRDGSAGEGYAALIKQFVGRGTP